MEITRIKRHPRRDRVRIWVDGEDRPRAELALDLVAGAGLAVGHELAEARLRELERNDEVYRARDAAVSLLAHRPRSRAELRRRLARRELGDAAIEATLEWLDERRYTDDRAFAESFVRDRLRLRPRGRFGLMQELRSKGVDEGTARAAIDAVMAAEETDEAALARSAAEAWARRNRSALRKTHRSTEDRLRARRRLYGHLARRGFAPDAVRSAVALVLDD
jgi:regulatory protein